MKIKYAGTDYASRITITAPFWQYFAMQRRINGIEPMPIEITVRPHWGGLVYSCQITGLNKYILRAYKHLTGN